MGLYNVCIMLAPADCVDCISPLQPVDTRSVSPAVRVFNAVYHREVPPHYRSNPYTLSSIQINLIMIDGGTLVVPRSPRTSFCDFYHELQHVNPGLFQRILSPSGTAKAASTAHVTPIKEITGMRLAGMELPGDVQRYGWSELETEANLCGIDLQILFQGNGLYYNRGSVFFDGEHILAYPDLFLADLLDHNPPPEIREQVAVSEKSLKRPLLFFTVMADGRMAPYVHRFLKMETYRESLARLRHQFLRQGVACALAASPPIVLPGERNEPVYLSLPEIIGNFHANDVRHSLYCPYEGAVLLSGELGRMQALHPAQLAAAVAEDGWVHLNLCETLHFLSPEELRQALERKGYDGRFQLESRGGNTCLSIAPLEGVYSHLLPFLTRQGVFGLIQTSGTHGNITGNDGPTLRQLSDILRALNSQPPFDHDPIIAAASGSQGNDVPNVICRSAQGQPGLLGDLSPETRLDEHPAMRGIVTTPRVGVGIVK